MGVYLSRNKKAFNFLQFYKKHSTGLLAPQQAILSNKFLKQIL
jgi:hypothetical protein